MRVLFIGDSRKMKGGVSTVIKTIEQTDFWDRYHCHWVQCQINSHHWLKVLYLLAGCLDALVRVPFYDVIFFHVAVGPSMITQMPFLLYAKLWRKKIVEQIHVGNQLTDHQDEKIFRFWVNSALLVLTLGKMWRDHLRNESWVKSRIEYIYNPVPKSFSPVAPKKYFLFAAYLDLNKGYDTLIAAFARVHENYPDWQLVICGDGERNKVHQCIEQAGIANSVVLPGWVTGAEKERLFGEAYAYCMTSEKEGLPMAVLESMAHSIAIISTHVGCLPEILTDRESAMLFDYGDTDALVQKMTELIEHPELRDKIASKGHDIIRHEFLADAVTQQLEQYLSSMK